MAEFYMYELYTSGYPNFENMTNLVSFILDPIIKGPRFENTGLIFWSHDYDIFIENVDYL